MKNDQFEEYSKNMLNKLGINEDELYQDSNIDSLKKNKMLFLGQS